MESRATYDVWGNRISSATPALSGFDTSQRGYTGHEHLATYGLIHMNGRIYDPLLGRFLQADPIIQSPYDLQSYNRYAYVMNNPLAYTDPTGYSRWNRWRKPVFAIAAGALTGWAASQWFLGSTGYGAAAAATVDTAGVSFSTAMSMTGTTFGVSVGTANGVIAGAAGGFAAGGIMGGTLNSALSGAFSGALSGGVAGSFGDVHSLSRVGAESIVEGINSKIQGGSFRDGFARGFAFSASKYLATNSRESMVKFAANVKGNVGYSPGAFGIDGRIGGELINSDEWKRITGVSFDQADAEYDKQLSKYWKAVKGGPFGAVQGRNPGLLLGFAYPAGGVVDRVVESFAGFHDRLNSPFFYNMDPTSKLYGTSHDFAMGWLPGEMLSGAQVLVAVPVVGAAMIPESMRSVVFGKR